MNFKEIVNAFYSPTCVVSVKKQGEGYGEIRIVDGNAKYIEMIDMRIKQEPEKVVGGNEAVFVPNSLYTNYFPHNRSFEDICFKAAVKKTEMHTYAHLNNIDVWFDIYAMPLEYEDGDVCYCTYTTKLNTNADSILDTVNVSQTSNDVLKTCINLHKADNLKDAMKNVISEIRQICDAEGCTLLLMNYDEERYSIMATDYVPGSTIRKVSTFTDFYDIANSWEKMIGDEGDCIIIKDADDMEYVKNVNNPWYLTLVEAGVKSVVLFPLRQGNELLGFMWAVNFDTDKTKRIKETLELATFFIASHIARYKVLKKLNHMSYTDALTGLPNRFACTDYVSNLISFKDTFAVVSVDLNNFKSINDTLGFDAGNSVLTEITKRWKTVTENIDPGLNIYIARISGDEFYLVISGYNGEEELRTIIDCYSEALGEKMTLEGYDLFVTGGFGYAEYPKDADNADTLISHANAAMYQIKKANSSEHVLKFTSDLLKDEQLLEVESTIRTALENETVYFNLQPQYDMNHKLRGFEVLARMKNSEGNNVSPGEFVPVAEKVGLIDLVDGMVFKKAGKFFGELIKKTDQNITLSINASVRHLMKSDFLDEIKNMMESYDIPAERLEVEITESIMIDSDKALQRIDELKNMGLMIAIDDFGTGYSSLSYLNRFPANLLKIDKSFIDEMNKSDSSRQYVSEIISIGHVMGFEVISEGVEEEEQLETLKEIGCDYIQGYLWGKPLSEEDARKLVLNEN
ncbi:MAG: EAL domain-containing protein [Lachnospiraceae bacterium]|nr:EAL domain-containing protein [Lachnospiraceae bacterium]